MTFRKGDSVRVKPGTPCPGFPEFDIGGWQGRVVDLTWADHPTEPVIGLALDSITLRSLPKWYLERCEQRGEDWSVIYLRPNELEPAEPRDTEQDVQRAVQEIEARVRWLGIGPEGKRIQEVVNSARSSRERDVVRAWEKYLKQHLRFPFVAVVDEFLERGPLRAGDWVMVVKIVGSDEHNGVLVACRKGRRLFKKFPLANLAAADENSPNAQPIQDYRVWFANR